MKSKSKMPKVLVGSLILIALVLLLSPRPGGAQSAIFIVNSTADSVDANPGDGVCADASGVCTLRAAIMEANALPGADTIAFDPSVFNAPQTITLSIPGVNEDFNATGDLDITDDLTMTGAGANITTIDGGGIDRVFDIRPFDTNVSISGLTVTGGKTLNSSPGGGSGGGIFAHGTFLTLTNVTVRDNEADYGGGIFVGGPVTLNNCTVSGNSALAGGGGGIINYINGPLTLNNSTVSGNTAGFGAGIGSSNHGNTLILNNSTVSYNVGPGLRMQAGTVIIKNTILANNTGGNCEFSVQSQLTAAIISLGHNLSTDVWCEPARIIRPNVSGGFDQPTDLNNTPALLAPLALNAPGSTKTHALLPGSPAIDAGGLDCSPADQRGIPRPQGAACDIGAYEVGVACAPPPPNMVAWWPGDGNANDIVGGNDGTLVGATIDPAGMVHQAFSFDGVNDFVAAPNSASLNPSGSFSIDAWVYPRSNGFQTIVGKWGDTGDQTNQRSYVLVNTTTGALNFGISDAAHQVDGAFHTLQTPAGALTLNAWNFVAVVYDQSTGTRRIFVNGSQQATRTDPPITVLNSVARFGIGADLTSSTTSTAHFDGLIDEVEFFNRALSASEIQAIFNAGSAGKCIPQPCPPTITCPANIVVDNSNSPGQCIVIVNYTVSATASCSSATVACSPTSGSPFPKGTTTVNCTVSDSSGNSSSCSFTVTVNDTQAPTVTCPSNVTVNTSPNQCSAAVNYPAPTATDNCPGVGTPTCSHSSGSTFPKGTTTVTCTATDASGNTGSSSFTVTVIPPKLTALNPAKVWIGLKTSDDVGTKFDLLAEVLKNGTVVGTGQLNGVPGGSSGFNNAVLRTINLALSSLPVDICPGDALGFKLSVRVAANSGHSSGTARLWYSGKFIDTGANRDAGSRFGATLGGGTANYFLRTGVLNTTAGSSKTFIDVPVNRNVGGNPFKPFGIWSITF